MLINFIAGMCLVIAMATGRTDICASGMIAIATISAAEVIRNLSTEFRKEEA